MKKICIVTGTRAEWGLLSRLALLIKQDNDLELQIIATNMHLSERYGLTYKEIEADGFTIDYRVPMYTEGDSEKDTVKSMAEAMSGFADAYVELKPDMIVVLGDRYEILVAVSAALIYKVPVAHLHGGEITEGAFDDAIRHAITKMSHLHFAACEEYRERIIQMGEQPNNVYNVGAIGVDNIKQIPLWSKEETEKSLGGFVLDKDTAIVTYHPVTLESDTAQTQIESLLGALDENEWLKVIFTMPNSDTGNQIIADKIKEWCQTNEHRAIWFTSLGLKRYLSTLQYVAMVIGNSSSGIAEVPSFAIPTINIGDRQKGRIASKSVVNCSTNQRDISLSIKKAHSELDSYKDTINVYDKANTAFEIYKKIKTELPSIQKKFYDINR